MKRIFIALFAIGLLGCGVAYTSYLRITKNFYEVDPGKFYRSAQLTKSELDDVISKYGIKTVISLRGSPPSFFGEEAEAETLSKHGVSFYPFALEMDYFPEKENLVKILDLYRDAPKPILLHCRSGADRTGMASALYVLEEMGRSKEEALQQLSFKYWHVRSFHPAMAEFVKIFESRSWAESSYSSCSYPKYVEHPEVCRK